MPTPAIRSVKTTVKTILPSQCWLALRMPWSMVCDRIPSAADPSPGQHHPWKPTAIDHSRPQAKARPLRAVCTPKLALVGPGNFGKSRGGVRAGNDAVGAQAAGRRQLED